MHMMEMLLKNKVTLVATILIAGGVLWYLFAGGSSSAPTSLLSTQGAGSAVGATDQTLVQTLLALRSVSLSGTILSDPAFRSLQDFGTQIVQEPIGRPDPFASFAPPAPEPAPVTAAPAKAASTKSTSAKSAPTKSAPTLAPSTGSGFQLIPASQAPASPAPASQGGGGGFQLFPM